MQPRIQRHKATVEEFCVLVRRDQKADLVDGIIYLAPPESLEANSFLGWVLWLVGGFVDAKDLGQVYFQRVAFRLGEHQLPEPDLAFVQSSRQHLARNLCFDGPPDLVIELVTAESIERDYDKKRKQYEAAGVREYWIIDPAVREVTLLRLQPNGVFAQATPNEGRLDSVVLPGFYLRPEWLWQSPLPKKAPILARLLNP
jgi:Uma2 family endonuclease